MKTMDDKAVPSTAHDENAESSPAEDVKQTVAASPTEAAGEKASPPEKVNKPSAKEKWVKKLTQGDEIASDETDATTKPEVEADSPEGKKPESEKAEGEETPAVAEDESKRTSTLSDEEFVKRLKPETARRFQERNEKIATLTEENNRMRQFAGVGERVQKLIAENNIPPGDFDGWTDLGVRIARNDPDTPTILMNMARGLASQLGVNLPKEASVYEHPSYKALKTRLTQQVTAGAMSIEDREAALDELASTLVPAPSQPSAPAARRPEAPQNGAAPAKPSQRVSLFSEPQLDPSIQAGLEELARKDKAMGAVHKEAWSEIQAGVAKKIEAMQKNAVAQGRPIHPATFAQIFDTLVETEVANRKAIAVKTKPPAVPPVLKPTSTPSGSTADGKTGRQRLIQKYSS